MCDKLDISWTYRPDKKTETDETQSPRTASTHIDDRPAELSQTELPWSTVNGDHHPHLLRYCCCCTVSHTFLSLQGATPGCLVESESETTHLSWARLHAITPTKSRAMTCRREIVNGVAAGEKRATLVLGEPCVGWR